VVGRAQKWTDSPLDQGWRPVRWNASGQVQELGILGTNFFGMTDGAASGLNSDGIAVGFLSEFDGLGNFIDFRAVAWGLDGNPIVLNSLLSPADAEHWVNLIEAWDISDSYWISGMGLYDPDGAGPLEPYERPFLLNAAELMISSVPEPAGVALLALAAPLLLRRRSSV
jgi:MYXO-CTERM domain-containing protein